MEVENLIITCHGIRWILRTKAVINYLHQVIPRKFTRNFWRGRLHEYLWPPYSLVLVSCSTKRLVISTSGNSNSSLSLFIRSHVPSPTSTNTKFFKKAWPYRKGIAGGTIRVRHKSIRNKFTGKYYIPTNFYSSSIPFRNARPGKALFQLFTLLIQISSLRRINNVFTSIIDHGFNLISHYTNNRVLSRLRSWAMTSTWIVGPCLIHQTRKPFYTTRYRQKNPASQGNYAYELHQVMILRLSRVGQTSCE